MYIYQHKNWPQWKWRQNEVNQLLIVLIGKQQHFLGKLEGLGFDVREKTALESEIKDILNNSEIEGNQLQESQIRSSIAKNLGIDSDEPINKSIETEGAINLYLDATRNFKAELTSERLFDWHAGLFPTGRSAGIKIEVSNYRSSSEPMQIVSGAMGREKVHYEAPASSQVPKMMDELIEYINNSKDHSYIKACIAHLWFEVIHPFEDGNGRIGRAIVDKLLCEADDSTFRYYSFSSTILKDTKAYYNELNKASFETMDITPWINWVLHLIIESIEFSEKVLQKVDLKRQFWGKNQETVLNIRQQKVLKKLLDNSEIKINSDRWSRINKCTKMTATRDINDLIEKGIFVKSESGGRSTYYQINWYE